MAYSDEWVIDQTLFSFFTKAGGHSCCGGVHHALMLDSALLQQLCSDMDTDQARQHTSMCPWPPCMKDALHKDMVAIRAKLKLRLPYYKEFVAAHFNAFAKWWTTLPREQKQSVFMMPVEEVSVFYTVSLDVKEAYQTLLSSILEQVKRFPDRDPPVANDGATPCERAYEQVLKVKKGAFVVQDTDYLETEAGMQAFLDMVRQVSGSSLLPKKEKSPGENSTTTSTLGFQGERRLVRLVIFRSFLDRAIRRFLQQQAEGMAAIAVNKE